MPASIDPERLSPDGSSRDRASVDGTGGSAHVPEKSRGPVVLRRGQVQATTTDERLLDSRGPSDWVHSDPWCIPTTRTLRSAGQRASAIADTG